MTTIFDMIDKINLQEELRIWDIKRLYEYLLVHKAEIKEIREIRDNVYEIDLVVKDPWFDIYIFPVIVLKPTK